MLGCRYAYISVLEYCIENNVKKKLRSNEIPHVDESDSKTFSRYKLFDENIMLHDIKSNDTFVVITAGYTII